MPRAGLRYADGIKMDINTELTAIKGIGEKTAGLFSKLHIMTVGQLLMHYPRDYDKMESTVTVSGLVPGRYVRSGLPLSERLPRSMSAIF